MSELALVSALTFDPKITRTQPVREGHTVAELVAIAMPGASIDMIDRAVVFLERAGQSVRVERMRWRSWRPKAGTTVVVHATVHNGAMRAVASLAIMAAAVFLAPYALTLIGVAASQLSLAVATGVISAAGQLLLNSLVPVGNKSEDESEQRYSIAGARNRANPWGPVPAVLGKLRVTPPYACLPYTSIEGDDQIMHAAFAVGYGPLVMGQARIGETALEEFAGVTIEYRAGWADDEPLTTVEETVIEDGLSIELRQADGWSTRRTASRTESISIDVYFPQGLNWIDDDQEVREQSLSLEVMYRKKGIGGAPDGDWTYVTALYIAAATRKPFWRSHRWLAADGPGTYDVRVRRFTPESTDSNTTDDVTWSVLRSIRHEYPIRFPKPLALVGLKLRANRQLNGTVNEFNLIASSIVTDWDGVLRESNNPQALYRHVLTGPQNALARSADQLDDANLLDWHGWCHGKGLAYNRYHDFDGSVREVAAAVAAAGRASPSQSTGLWGVVIDRPQTVVRGHISSRNAQQLSGEPVYRRLPDAWRMPYLDEDDDYKPTELIVPRPGLEGDPVIFEELSIPGLTKRSLVWREGRRRFAELELRFEDFQATQDIEMLFSPRGSLVQFNFPVLSERMVSARVKQVQSGTIAGSPATLVLLDDQVIMVEGGSYAVRFQRSTGETSLWTLVTRPGTSRTLRLGTGGTLPAIGDLALFGLLGFDSADCIVKSIEPAKGPAGRLRLVRHAPEIEAIADDNAVPPVIVTPREPAWAARPPATPILIDALSGADAVILGETGSPVIVHVRPGTGTVPVDHFTVTAQRGTETPIDVLVPGNSGRALFDDFAVGDVISITATAVSAYGVESGASAALEHTVTARRDVPADLVDLVTEEFSSGMRRFAWNFDPAATVDQIDRITGYRIRYRPGSGWSWAEMATGTDTLASARPFDSIFPLTAGPHTIGIVATDRSGRLSVNPCTVDVTLGTSSAAVHATRVESADGWDGSLTSGTIETDRLEGTGSPSTIIYELPVIDLGADLPIEVQATPYGAAGAVTIRMTIGLDSDGAPVWADRALGIVTARYVALTITVTRSGALASLGDLVTIVTPA